MTLIFDSLELVNFMCHSHLKINFKKKVTFIGGLNGSGKSAIMIAMGLILGERVKNLERGNSAKELIKTGKSFSIVKLCLWNTARFHSDFFGDKIYIEKKITPKLSTLLIYNQDKKVWRKKVEDLEQLLEYFSISFRNPINFLTQEHAKKFLNVTKPSLLYEFFMKGTELEENKYLHKEAMQESEEMKSKIETVQQRTDLIEKELQKNKRRIEAIENVEIWEEKIKSNELELKWSKLEFERISDLKNTIFDLENKLDDDEKAYSEALKSLTQLRNDHTKKMEDARKEAKDNEELEKQYEAKITEQELNKREMENDLKEIEESIKRQEQEINEQQKGFSEEKYKELENKKAERIRRLERLIEEKENMDKQKNDLIVASEKEAERIQILKTQITSTRAMIEDNKRIKNNNLTFFGQKMPSFVDLVQKTSFKGKVIGPLSNLIQLKERKWYKPISNILNNFLNSYIVYEREDKEKMYEIMRRLGINTVSIYVPSSKSEELIKYRKNNNYKTVLDVLQCENNVVINQLIILAQIESIILIENRSDAHKIIKSRPNDVDCAFTLNGDQIKMYGNNLTDFAVNVSDKYFFQNSTDKINDLERRLVELQKRPIENIYKNDLYLLRNKQNDIEQTLDRLKIEIKDSEIEMKSMDLIRSKVYEKDINNLKEELEINNKQKEELRKMIENANEEINAVKNEIKKLSIKYAYGEYEYKKNEEVLNDNMHLTFAKMSMTNKELEKKMAELQTLDTKVKKQRAELLALGHPEFDEIRSEKVITEELYELKAKLKMHNETSDKENIKFTMQEYENEKSHNLKLIEETKKKLIIMNEYIKKRIDRREEIKHKESLRASKEFANYMMEREYEGKLIFDHDKELLNIKVKLKTNRLEGDKNTLSGGEKSFAGICLLLSLWPSVTCPIKILDEFDVFMDNLNRNSAIQSIIKYSEKEQSQLILITPLDTYNLKSDYCDVVVLEAPRKTNNIV